ncbi:hypothetical protein GYMLUDRAFT_252775 [Collybiopsis luxurians FD-317 M1]|uniref:Uncharacterized protein n=1 Tax=Collybiopsis luxurians FD-317 M1 TaxID=944289 RepID=A0A0D0C7D8_9AGAR|nr:hypothetical protein GYMLUDRAFT_252775 [Collybiopsis luxurians FD-317 M1]
MSSSQSSTDQPIASSISITDCIPSSLPTGLQPIYEDAYLANSSPEVLDRVAADEWESIFRRYPSCEYCASHNLHSTCSLRPNSLLCATCEVNYPSKELGLASGGPRALEGKRKAVVSLNAFQKSQLLRQERELLGEPSHEQVVPAPSRKGKEVICDPIDTDVEMEAPDAMESMELDYPEEVPSTSALVPAVPAPALTKPAVIWKVNDRRSYREVSSLKTWFFEPLVKPVPSNSTIPSRDDMIRAAIERIIICGKVMMEQDLWALVDGLVQGVFNDLEEQMKHPSSDPPAPFLNSGLTQFIESLSMINLSSANIYQALSWKADHLETENLHLKEQVSSRDSQLEEKDKELTHLKSFVRYFKGDVPSTEVQQLREALEGQESEIESLKAKLAVSEEARRVAAEESKLRDEELTQLRQLFKSVRGQFAAASPAKHSSGSS